MMRSTDVDSGVVMPVVKTGGALRPLQVSGERRGGSWPHSIEIALVPLPSRAARAIWRKPGSSFVVTKARASRAGR
jgi:hypothetical protein